MNIQKLYSLTRQAINDYDLISDGDRIAVGVSGGKDSLTLLTLLSDMRRFFPVHYDLMAITCDVGFDGMDFTPIADLCRSMDIPYEVFHTEISRIVFENNKDERPCSLCAKLRKGAMYKRLTELGFNKIAYAHNKDDLIETAFMSLIYEGRFYSFPPLTNLDGTGITVIRPMIYIPERSAARYSEERALPVIVNKCPVDGSTKREYAKRLVSQICRDNPEAKDRLLHAIICSDFDDWPKKHASSR